MQNIVEGSLEGGSHPFQDARLFTLLRYWHDRRREGMFPSRQSIDPLELTSMLSGIWLTDFEPEHETFRYRLAGEDVNNALGTTVRGKLLSDFLDDAAFPKVNGLLRRVIEEPAVLYVSGTVHRNIDRYTRGERLALPLQTESDRPNGLLGVTLVQSHLMSMEDGSDHNPNRRFFSLSDLDQWLGTT